MIHKALAIGCVLFARLLVHAQGAPVAAGPIGPAAPTEVVSSYRFDGRLVHRSSDGSFGTVFPDAVFVGWGDDGCQFARQSSERVNFYADGVFPLTISKRVTTVAGFEDGSLGRPAPTRVGPETVSWPCYRFRVEGCDDAIIQFGPTRPGSSIELTCPGRDSSPRRDG